MPSFLDTGAILLGTFTVRLAVALAMALYARYQRTCPGFSQWVAGMVLGLVARGLRLLTPVVPLADTLLATPLQTLTAVFLLDGVCRYVLGRPLDRRWYGVPVLGLGVTALLELWFPQPPVLAWWTALVPGGLTLAGGVLWLRRGAPGGRPLRWSTAFLHFAFVATVASREVVRAVAPSWWNPGLDAPFFLTLGVLDMMALASFVMLNGRRLEDDLNASTSRLQATVEELQENLDRVRMLTGILPICAECKKIRDEEGRWTPVDDYMAQRIHARFSPGVCPRCRAALAGRSPAPSPEPA